MFERLQKPFLTVETGEAYQPVRITYDLLNADAVDSLLGKLKCVEPKNGQPNSWEVFWRGESDDLHFESLESYKKPAKPVRLGSFIIKGNTLYLNLPSFKRACLLLPVLHQLMDPGIVKIKNADFINKVFGLNERLPHGFSEIYDDEELERIVHQRIADYEEVQARCEEAATAEEAFRILSEYSESETHKRLPYAERYHFFDIDSTNVDDIYLGFYIFMRSRELVAINRWFGEAGYTLGDALDEAVEQVFGGMNIDIIE